MFGLQSLSEASRTSAPPVSSWSSWLGQSAGAAQALVTLHQAVGVEMGTCMSQLIMQNQVAQHRGPYMLMNNGPCLHSSALVYFS